MLWLPNSLVVPPQRSPLSKVSQMKEGTATLIFIGPEDKRVMPEAQGIAYYKALRSQKKTFTSLYHYPGIN